MDNIDYELLHLISPFLFAVFLLIIIICGCWLLMYKICWIRKKKNNDCLSDIDVERGEKDEKVCPGKEEMESKEVHNDEQKVVEYHETEDHGNTDKNEETSPINPGIINEHLEKAPNVQNNEVSENPEKVSKKSIQPSNCWLMKLYKEASDLESDSSSDLQETETESSDDRGSDSQDMSKAIIDDGSSDLPESQSSDDRDSDSQDLSKVEEESSDLVATESSEDDTEPDSQDLMKIIQEESSDIPESSDTEGDISESSDLESGIEDSKEPSCISAATDTDIEDIQFISGPNLPDTLVESNDSIQFQALPSNIVELEAVAETICAPEQVVKDTMVEKVKRIHCNQCKKTFVKDIGLRDHIVRVHNQDMTKSKGTHEKVYTIGLPGQNIQISIGDKQKEIGKRLKETGENFMRIPVKNSEKKSLYNGTNLNNQNQSYLNRQQGSMKANKFQHFHPPLTSTLRNGQFPTQLNHSQQRSFQRNDHNLRSLRLPRVQHSVFHQTDRTEGIDNFKTNQFQQSLRHSFRSNISFDCRICKSRFMSNHALRSHLVSFHRFNLRC